MAKWFLAGAVTWVFAWGLGGVVGGGGWNGPLLSIANFGDYVVAIFDQIDGGDTDDVVKVNAWDDGLGLH